jgi:parallel beta-helix repeat protein
MKTKKLRLESLESRITPATFSPTITIGDVEAVEGQQARVPVYLSDTPILPIKISYETANDSARSGSDYQSAKGTLAINRGENVGYIYVDTIDDAIKEAMESFVVNLKRINYGKIRDKQAVVKIIDDDSLPPAPTPTGPRGPQQNVVAPQGALIVTPSTASQIDNAPAGATVYLRAGIYDVTIVPKTGQTFIGEYGAILRSTTKQFAFRSSANDVTIKNLTIDGYRPGQWYFGAIQSDKGLRWSIENVEVKNSTHRGVSIFDGSQVINSYIHHNGHLGIKVDGLAGYSGEPTYLTDKGEPVLVANNEIAHNNTAHADVGHDAGGLKVWNTNNVTVENNFVHHNWGNGIWFDVDNYNGVIRNNLVEDNEFSGIYIEISRRITVENNTVNRNGRNYATDNWRVVAGISVDTSSDVIVRGNTLINNGNSLTAVAQSNRSGEGRQWYLQRVVFDSNDATMDRGRVGRVMDATARNNQSAMADVKFTNNEYTVSGDAGWIWDNWESQKINWTQWRTLGQDLNGVLK